MRTIKVTTQDMLNDVLQLRNLVFVEEQGVDPQLEYDQYDTLDNPLVDHFAYVIMDNVVIGTSRCIFMDDKTVRLGRFSIHPKLRHQGFGIKFLRDIENYYYTRKVEHVIIHAQKHAVSFYTTAGYETFGPEYEEAGIPHQNMRKKLYQHFYTKFADVYDLIFPLTENKKKMLDVFAQDKQSILDIGGGTGLMSEYLNSLNIKTTTIDLDHRMILEAQEKGIDAYVLDMRQINGLTDKYDGILCTGNVLVHLDNHDEVNQFLEDCYNLLNPNGELVIQIINYYKVITQNINELPLIRADKANISLQRKYYYNDKIKFNTTLTIGKQQYHDSIELLPLLPNELEQLALQNHFEVIATYGNFDFSAYTPELSDQFIIRLRKEIETSE